MSFNGTPGAPGPVSDALAGARSEAARAAAGGLELMFAYVRRALAAASVDHARPGDDLACAGDAASACGALDF